MSGGPACHCDERKKPIKERKWAIWQYKHNRSAFNGYHKTSSDYSQLFCASCQMTWRTKADYVMLLKFGEK